MTQEIINFDKECDEKNYIETMADDTFLSDVNNKQHIYENNKGNYVYASDNVEEDSIVETTALRQNSETSKGTSSSITSENYLILPGTLKRGRNKTRQVEVVLNMSREELELLELNIMTKKKNICYNSLNGGMHVFLWSIICSPISLILSSMYSFFMGTLTWYGIFSMFSETKSFKYKIIVPPILIILYPFLIVFVSLCLGIYAGFKQVSWYWNIWLDEFTDYDKGFFGWLCNVLDIPECSPYEIIILSNVYKP